MWNILAARRAVVVGLAGLLVACGGDGTMPIYFPDDGGGDADGAGYDGADADDGIDDGAAETPPDGIEPDVEDAAEDVGEEDDGGGLPRPLDELDDLALYVNIGDSLAAGYNAAGRNGSGGHGYARLMLENHADYPAYDGHSLRALFPDARFVDVSESGATSGDALDNLRSALGGSLPASVDGDVLVSLTCGGNDFNDDVMTIIVRATTEAVAARLQDNYREIFRLLRGRYEDPAAGHAVVFLVTNVHDPTGGTGAIPAGFRDGFCATINDPRLIPLRAVAIANLGVFNDAIAAVAGELGGQLVDNHGVFLEHGMNAPGAERWLSDDCVHPTDEGHHQLRREEWLVLTGEAW